MSVRDDPFVLICIEARTRAFNMGYDACPQLDQRRARKLYAETSGEYRAGADVGEIIHRVLNWNEPFGSDDERYGYAVAIGLGIYRIRVQRDDDLEEHARAHPTPPIDLYEQEM